MKGVVNPAQSKWYKLDKNGNRYTGGCVNVLGNGISLAAGAFPSHTFLVQIGKADAHKK